MPLPRPLSTTGRIAVAAPASAALKRADVEAGLDALRARGLDVDDAQARVAPHGYLAGDDDARAEAFNALLRRGDLDAIVCLRGGYGSLRILDRIDYAAARAHPKLLVGYSDVTALHLALYRHAGWTGLSGPMVAPDWPGLDAESEAQFWHVAGGAVGPIAGPGDERLVPLREGRAGAPLRGRRLGPAASGLSHPLEPRSALLQARSFRRPR